MFTNIEYLACFSEFKRSCILTERSSLIIFNEPLSSTEAQLRPERRALGLHLLV